METSRISTILTPEQDAELDILVRIAYAIAAHKQWSFDEFDVHLKFLLSCLCAAWGIQPGDLPGVMLRVNEIGTAQKAEMLAEFGRRLQA